MRANFCHHLLGAFASTVAACKSSRRHIVSHICTQLISAYGVSFVHLVMKHHHFFLHLQHRNLELFPLIKISLLAYLTLQPCLIVPAAPLQGLCSLVLRWHTFTTSIFIPISTLNFCLSRQKVIQLIHFFPSYSMKLQSTKVSEKKWEVRHCSAPCCLSHISGLSWSHFAEAIGVRFVRLQAVKMIKWLVVALEMIHQRQRGGGVFIF